jgi:thiol-disulfide isomerase/thioredoxin
MTGKAFCLVVIGLALGLHVQAMADSEIRLSGERTIPLNRPPTDAAVSANGKWIYALTPEGELLIYSADGTLAGRLPVGEPKSRIRVGPKEDVLLLMNPEKSFLRVVTLDFVKRIRSEGSPFKGPRDATVVITEFTEFQCPHCAAFAPVLRQVQEKYPEQVKIVFKNYPLKSHQFSVIAAAAALAAERQGAFWRFHDKLFENRNSLSQERIRKISVELGLDQEKFMRDLRDGDIMRQIREDVEDAQSAGVTGVPAAFVNGRPVRDRSLHAVLSLVEEELRRASNKEEECLECTDAH